MNTMMLSYNRKGNIKTSNFHVSGKRSRKKNKVKFNFLRFGITMLIVSILLISTSMIAFAMFSDKTDDLLMEEMYEMYFVNSGDNLWGIAINVNKNVYHNSKDIRKIVNEIQKINNMDDTLLKIGDIIYIPKY